MLKLIYMLGIPGCGKSYMAKKIAKQERAEIISTDEIRRELFGDARKQKQNFRVYQEAFSQIHKAFLQGKSAILDATNIDRDLRMKGIARFPNVVKECYYVDTPYDVCLTRNASRKRKVEAKIMAKMYRFFEFPIYGEGWDQIHIVHHEKPYAISKDSFVSLLNQNPNYDDLFNSLSVIDSFAKMIQYNQENPHHTHPLCMHTYKVFEYISQNYKEDDKLAMQIAALFHDIGKPFTKVIKKGRDYASYFLHENVSTHMAVHFLKELGFEDDFVMKTANIIQMHMKIVYGDNGASEIYHLLDDEYLWKLYFFAEGDALAKN